jgi:hypothetical protein
VANADELIVKIGADFEELKKELKKATGGIEELGSETKKSSDKMAKANRKADDSFNVLGVQISKTTAALSAVTTAVGLFTKAQIEAARETQRWSANLGVSTQAFSELAAVGRRFGATTDDVGDAIKDLNERIADASNGTKTYEEALNRAGLSSKELIDLSPDEQFIAVADAIGKMNNQGQKNLAIADLMADAGFRLTNMFDQGADSINRMRREVSITNEAMSGEAAQAFETASLRLSKFADIASGFGADLLQPFVEASGVVAEGWSRALIAVKTAFAETEKESSKLKKSIDEIGESLEKVGRGQGGILALNLERSKETVEALRDRMGDINRLGLADDHPLRVLTDEKLKAAEDRVISLSGRLQEMGAIKTSAPAIIPEIGGVEDQTVGISADPEGDELTGMFNKFMGSVDKEKLQSEIEALQEANAILENLELTKISNIEQARLEAIMAERESQALLEEERQGFRDREYSAEEAQVQRIMALASGSHRDRLRLASGFFGDLVAITNNKNRELFEASKAFAIADAVVSTAQGAANAFRDTPYPYNFIASASVVAAGMAQVQKISSTSFGGGGGGGGGASAAAPTNQPEESEPATQVLETNVTFAGDSISQEQFRGFVGGLNEAIDDGVTIGRINA